jgi:hypothetical protein
MMRTPNTAELRDRQVRAEQESVDEAKARYEKESSELKSRSGQAFIQKTVLRLAEAIGREQEAILKGRKGARLQKSHLPLLALSAEKQALIVLSVLYQRLAILKDDRLPRETAIAREVAGRCWWQRTVEVRTGRAIDLERKLAARYQTKAKRRARIAAQRLDRGRWADDYRDVHLGKELALLVELHQSALLAVPAGGFHEWPAHVVRHRYAVPQGSERRSRYFLSFLSNATADAGRSRHFPPRLFVPVPLRFCYRGRANI